ncbi:hypothetical protein T439DRAFT_323880 [Meredithblackwellia eburnea MCA 4105]
MPTGAFASSILCCLPCMIWMPTYSPPSTLPTHNRAQTSLSCFSMQPNHISPYRCRDTLDCVESVFLSPSSTVHEAALSRTGGFFFLSPLRFRITSHEFEAGRELTVMSPPSTMAPAIGNTHICRLYLRYQPGPLTLSFDRYSSVSSQRFVSQQSPPVFPHLTLAVQVADLILFQSLDPSSDVSVDGPHLSQ